MTDEEAAELLARLDKILEALEKSVKSLEVQS